MEFNIILAKKDGLNMPKGIVSKAGYAYQLHTDYILHNTNNDNIEVLTDNDIISGKYTVLYRIPCATCDTKHPIELEGFTPESIVSGGPLVNIQFSEEEKAEAREIQQKARDERKNEADEDNSDDEDEEGDMGEYADFSEDQLRKILDDKGILYDGRWGKKRLLQELEK